MRILQQPARRGVTCLVEGDDLLLFGRNNLVLLFETTDDTVDSIEEVLLIDFFLTFAGGHQCGLVAHVGNVGT